MIRQFRYNEIDRSEIFSRDIASTKMLRALFRTLFPRLEPEEMRRCLSIAKNSTRRP